MTQPPPGQPQGWWQPQGTPSPPHGQAAPGHPPPVYGGGFQSQYGGFGAFGAGGPAPAPRKSRKPLLIAVAAVLVLAGGGVAAWLLGAFRGDVLDAGSVERGVAQVLRDSYGEHDVRAVQCPDGQPIETGHTFDCSVEVAGKPRTVSIRVLNDQPEFEVGAPR
ncbi:uncharacterized protein DUF4333 [Prauserella shujinwangii]|uniref:Uncharacterized protein DUF4333 n=1 Tax=Prauserella shujinwangii TaxID=1453103 RepID=A0A2T0LLY2_9PSEU|nr:DUF4333 domain-containing protein [Prauserella shujinwangii]PRX43980.1 uncharacterized protein DUF4333 [Prauserella shujinwangii]